ncbi:hypothetical protein HNY73_020316 [Argiope bruennichi]|uniref:Uncharacterized protein n=1 Tax=Argiope bruennichi TaxID=94029 RepID=A0A8T0E7G4_ARGBR|nr:hypothetical protein HNY73_020316 [Argiope bruennichi]
MGFTISYSTRFENGTVVGVYAVGEDTKRHITVRYIADANGYRAEIFKDEAFLRQACWNQCRKKKWKGAIYLLGNKKHGRRCT